MTKKELRDELNSIKNNKPSHKMEDFIVYSFAVLVVLGLIAQFVSFFYA